MIEAKKRRFKKSASSNKKLQQIIQPFETYKD